jgi:hypothetical protein
MAKEIPHTTPLPPARPPRSRPARALRVARVFILIAMGAVFAAAALFLVRTWT